MSAGGLTWTDWSAEIGVINKSTKKNICPKKSSGKNFKKREGIIAEKHLIYIYILVSKM